MVIEYAPLAVVLAAFVPKYFNRVNERTLIEMAFKNLKFGIKSGHEMKYPEFMKKHEGELATRYDYRLMPGLLIPENLAEILSKALGKSVDVDGDSVMSIWVFKKKLPSKVEYEELPSINGW